MSRLYVPAATDLALVAPKVREAVAAVLQGMTDDGWKPKVVETLRTDQRQNFLFGKGRTAEQCLERLVPAVCGWPACPDGRVTNAPWANTSWHGFGLAVDIAEADATPWTAPQGFWHSLGTHARLHGLVWGGSWRRFPDLPHVQWDKCAMSPTPDDQLLLREKGMQAVWAKYHAA